MIFLFILRLVAVSMVATGRAVVAGRTPAFTRARHRQRVRRMKGMRRSSPT
jgi:hypothetical protein